jgi:hypothetical protein
MNQKIKELAEQAGFVLWKDESWNPGDVIDWSCRYDDEFKKFADLLLKECIQVLIDNGYPNAHKEYVGVEHIKKHFDITT